MAEQKPQTQKNTEGAKPAAPVKNPQQNNQQKQNVPQQSAKQPQHQNQKSPSSPAPVTKPQSQVKPETKKEIKAEIKNEVKNEVKIETKAEAKSDANSAAPNQAETKKPEQPKKIKKEESIVRGLSLHISKKHSMYLSRFIKMKKIDSAIADLESVLKFKRAVPFKGEIPHRHDPGMMSGRYPINAAREFITMLKTLKGNTIANGMDLDRTRIYYASASWASRPSKRSGARSKRTHIVIKAKEMKSQKEESKEKKK